MDPQITRSTDNNKLNRRKLLKTAAITGAGSVVGAAGVNSLAPMVLTEEMVFEPNHSHWAKALPPANPSLHADLEADVVVIGGGFTGLSTAFYLKRDSVQKNLPDKKVVLLEAGSCGNGASGRNGAMMLTLTEDRYMQWSGDPALDKKIYDLTVENIHALHELSATTGIDCELEQKGALQVCNTPEIAAAAKATIGKFRGAGFPFEFWDAEKTAAAIGTTAYEGACYDPNSGQVHPGKVVKMFKAAAESAGVEIYEGTPVVHIEEGAVHTLTTANGRTVRAKALVLGTNAFTSKLGYLRRVVTPISNQVGITAPLNEQQLAGVGWRSRMPFNDCRTEVYYLGLTQDNRIHIGGGPEYSFNNGVRERADAAWHVQLLHEELVRIFPKLAGVPFETTWGGSVDMSLDGSPAVGQMGKYRNVFYGIGFSGHGVNLTSVFGRILGDLVAGGGEQWSWLPYLNHLPPYTPNEPFRWLGVQIALGYYRVTDPKTP
jgi:gamma-glutamylputrescine oxidase